MGFLACFDRSGGFDFLFVQGVGNFYIKICLGSCWGGWSYLELADTLDS